MKAKTVTQVTVWLAALAVMAVVSLAEVVIRSWALILAAAGLGAGCYVLGRVHGSRRAARRAAGELAAARESAELAWDAAADRPPRRSREPGPALARLLADPRSGIRPLYLDEESSR